MDIYILINNSNFVKTNIVKNENLTANFFMKTTKKADKNRLFVIILLQLVVAQLFDEFLFQVLA